MKSKRKKTKDTIMSESDVKRHRTRALRKIREYKNVFSKMERELDSIFRQVERRLPRARFEKFMKRMGMTYNPFTEDFELHLFRQPD